MKTLRIAFVIAALASSAHAQDMSTDANGNITVYGNKPGSSTTASGKVSVQGNNPSSSTDANGNVSISNSKGSTTDKNGKTTLVTGDDKTAKPCTQPLRELKNFNGKLQYVTTREGTCDENANKIPTSPDMKKSETPTAATAAPKMRSDVTGLRSDQQMLAKQKEKKEK